MSLKDKTSFYKVCFDSMQVGILVFNKDKEILLTNNSISDIFGFSAEMLLGSDPSKLVKSTIIFDDFIENSLEEKFKSSIDLTGIKNNGDEFPIQLSFGKMEYENKPLYKALISNLSLQKKKEEEISKLTFKLEEEVKVHTEELIKVVDQLKMSFHEKNKPFEESEILLRAVESELKGIVGRPPEQKTPIQIMLKNKSPGNLSTIKNIDQFLEKKRVYNYKKDDTIYCRGNLSSHIFLIKKGVIKTYKIDDFGKEYNTGYFTDEQYFGFSSFAKSLPHFENSKAITDTQLYKINKAEIASIISNNHHIIYSFINLLVSNLIDNKEQLLLLAYGSVRKKTAITLLNLLEKYPIKTNNKINISRFNLANSIGIAKETLVRTLHDFKAEKLIEVSSKGIKIINKKKLLKIS